MHPQEPRNIRATSGRGDDSALASLITNYLGWVLGELEPGVVEVKRMYVDPDCRDRHLGSGILDLLLAQAAATFRANTVRLDTCRFMHAAQRLYRSRGFEERPPYEGTEIPPHVQKYWMFFEKPLLP